ncbi:hypothetical protein ACFONN_13425 [Dyella humi]|uniref:Uncharacterized protein n=1 Tax=Dyella humi TaxID=1770547 RepID=A0ABW8IP10_9GAMM
MTLYDGLLLLGGVVVLYLYDSALLLFHNEIVLVGQRHGYGVSAGSGLELAGRHVYLPSPLFPHQPLFRMSWPQNGVPARHAPLIRVRRVRVALAAASGWMLLLLVLFAVGLPYVLLVTRDARLLLAWIAAVYTVIGILLMHVYRHRKTLNLSRRAVVAIAMDALLCAPFALNMVRKIGLRQRLDVDLRTAANSMLSANANRELLAILRQRIQTSLGFVEPDEVASHALATYLADFEGLCK